MSSIDQFPPTINTVLQQGGIGQHYHIYGWIRSARGSKHVGFASISDGSCHATLQVVLDLANPSLAAIQKELQTGASVHAYGQLIASPAAGQRVELQVQNLELLGASNPETYPLQKKEHSLEFLRSIAHLRARTNTFGAVFRIRATLAQATHDFFRSLGFANVQTPIITTSDCEGAGETFHVVHTKNPQEEPFFGKDAMLTVSGQLNGESLAYGLGRIYTFGPTFRAENSNTIRHLSEFWMIEPEMAFCNLRLNMQLAEAYLKTVVRAVLNTHEQDIAFLSKHNDVALQRQLQQIAETPFVHATYTEAVDILLQSKQNFSYPVGWGNDLQAEHERFLVETHFKQPLILTDYPTALKSFYMYQNDDNKTVAAMDVLVARIGEIIGGSQREHRLDRLEQRMLQKNMQLEHYAWYLDLQRFGAVPHAGFGLGFERLVMLCTGMSNIRDVVPFPRVPGSAAY